MTKLLVLLFALLPLMANADTQPNVRGNWFVEGRYQKSLYLGNGWTENEVDLGGASNNMISATSEKRDELNASGLAVGHNFINDKVSLSLAYEKFASSIWSAGNYVSRDGRTFDSAHYPMKMHHFIAEISYNQAISDSTSIVYMGGLGQANIKTDSYTKAISGASATGSIAEKYVRNFSKRIGIGLTNSISTKFDIIGLLQYSDYGDAKTRCCNETSETFDTEVTAIEAGIRLRYHF